MVRSNVYVLNDINQNSRFKLNRIALIHEMAFLEPSMRRSVARPATLYDLYRASSRIINFRVIHGIPHLSNIPLKDLQSE